MKILIMAFVVIHLVERLLIERGCVVQTSGRVGNYLSELVFSQMMLARHHIRHHRKTGVYPFNNTGGEVETNFGGSISIHHFLWFGLDLRTKMNMKNYMGRRGEVVQLMGVLESRRKFDVVIHVHLDHAYDTLLPLSYYRSILPGLDNVETICIVSKPIDVLQLGLLNDIQEYVYEVTGVDAVVITGDVEEAFEVMMSGSTFVGSTSSFWIWPVFVSSVVKAVYFPLFGQMTYMGLTEREMKDGEDRVFYGKEIAIREKITLETLHLFYDV